MARIPIADDAVAAYVKEDLQVRTLSGGEFTAYDVTRALRRRHRRLDIRHDVVRSLVHRSMSSLVAAGIYYASQRAFRGKMAIQMYVGTEDPGLDGNRRMHAVLDELKIAHGYEEFPGIAHNLVKLSEQVKAGNFALAARSFRHGAAAEASADGSVPAGSISK